MGQSLKTGGDNSEGKRHSSPPNWLAVAAFRHDAKNVAMTNKQGVARAPFLAIRPQSTKLRLLWNSTEARPQNTNFYGTKHRSARSQPAWRNTQHAVLADEPRAPPGRAGAATATSPPGLPARGSRAYPGPAPPTNGRARWGGGWAPSWVSIGAPKSLVVL